MGAHVQGGRVLRAAKAGTQQLHQARLCRVAPEVGGWVRGALQAPLACVGADYVPSAKKRRPPLPCQQATHRAQTNRDASPPWRRPCRRPPAPTGVALEQAAQRAAPRARQEQPRRALGSRHHRLQLPLLQVLCLWVRRGQPGAGMGGEAVFVAGMPACRCRCAAPSSGGAGTCSCPLASLP